MMWLEAVRWGGGSATGSERGAGCGVWCEICERGAGCGVWCEICAAFESICAAIKLHQ